MLDRMWPSLTAAGLVRELLTNPRRLGEAADGLLDGADQQTLRRPRSARQGWSEDDLPLLDEAEALVNGDVPTFGHVVVDEAQNLSPMELRMVRRRSAQGSMTILGDLAQATSPWAPSGWSDLLQHLGAPDGTEVHELPRAYRSTRPIPDLANRLLPEMAVQVQAPEPIRSTGPGPTIRPVPPQQLVAEAVAVTSSLAKRWRSTAVVATEQLLAELEPALRRAGLTVGDARQDELTAPVTVITPELTRGLEFDAVVLVDPATFTREHGPAGRRLLYVTLTRANQQLAIVHSTGLPTCLGLGDAGSAVADPPALPVPEELASPEDRLTLARSTTTRCGATARGHRLSRRARLRPRRDHDQATPSCCAKACATFPPRAFAAGAIGAGTRSPTPRSVGSSTYGSPTRRAPSTIR
jgi:DNA helicase IV